MQSNKYPLILLQKKHIGTDVEKQVLITAKSEKVEIMWHTTINLFKIYLNLL